MWRHRLLYLFVGHAGNKINELTDTRKWVVGMERNFAAQEGGWCTPPPRLVTFGLGVSMGSQNIEGSITFCNAFLKGGFTDLNEIWHDRGFMSGSRS